MGSKDLAGWLVVVFLVYASVASTAFRFRHPHMTDTQLFLHLPDAMAWRVVPKETP